MDELRWILDQGNSNFLPELNTQRATFLEGTVFWSVQKGHEASTVGQRLLTNITIENPTVLSINVCLITGCRKTNLFFVLFLTVKHSVALMKVFPNMFPSPVVPPKKLGHASEALLHILEVRKLTWVRIFTLLYRTIQRVHCGIYFSFCVCQPTEDPNTPDKTTLQPCRSCLWNQLHTG